MRERLLEKLTGVVGTSQVLTAPETMVGHLTDVTGRYRGQALAVVRPADTDEVAAVLRACHDAGVAVVPQGGNTGLVGGAVPDAGQVLLSTTRLTGPITVDPAARTLAAPAGQTLAAAQTAAADSGYTLGLDLAARDSATLGGMVATNAGGLQMIRHGDTRSRLLGLTAVTADGRVLRRWKPLRKDNVGYHLPSLIAGSEGTLAVVTEVLLRLSIPSGPTRTALIGVDTVAGALTLVTAAERAGLAIEAAEIMTASGLEMVRTHLGVADPLGVPACYALLLEVSAPAGVEELLTGVLAAEQERIGEAVVDSGAARRLWRLREQHTETIGRLSRTSPLKLDVTLPAGALDAFVEQVPGVVAQATRAAEPDGADRAAARAVCFGHVGDGNIHVNVLDLPEDDADRGGVRHAVTDAVLHLVAGHDGSISAEHGIGRAKTPWLALGRGAVDRELMAAVRRAFDPRGVLNPGVLDFEAAG